MNDKLALSILEDIVRGCKHPLDYEGLIPNHGLSPHTLSEIREFLSNTLQGGQREHDSFVEDGGLTVACLLYCEVLRLKEAVCD